MESAPEDRRMKGPSERKPGPKEAGPLPVFEMKDMKKGVKLAFSIGGIAIGAGGILLTMAAYFLISSAISDSQSALMAEMGAAYYSLDSAESAADSLVAVLEPAPDSLDSLAAGLESYRGASLSSAQSVDALANALSSLTLLGVPASAGSGLRSAATELRTSAAEMGNASSSMRTMSANIESARSNATSLRDSIGSMKSSLLEARDVVERAFSNISLGVLLLCGALCALFVMIMAYSIPAAL